MDLSFSAEQVAFRQEIRDFLDNEVPTKFKRAGLYGMPEIMQWHRLLYKKGWVAPHWPAEHGGPGFDSATRFILTEELELAGTPGLSPFGLSMVAPLLMQYGNEQQRARFLPEILSGNEVWCQGYSEPNAGSDLAALQMRAVDDGEGNFILNGQKTWTTYAQYADWIFCLVRTDTTVKKQAGISFLLIDMKSPGITVRPNMTIGGFEAFCDTFFDDVKVPQENLVGAINAGWTVAKALLGHERTLIAAVGRSRRALLQIKKIATETFSDGQPLIDNAIIRHKIAALEVRLQAHQMVNYRALAKAQLGHAPGAESSILKIVGTEISQACTELAMEIMGYNGLSWFNDPGVIPDHEHWIPSAYNYLRAATIYGGSNEIQKNIIAKWILGLPQA